MQNKLSVLNSQPSGYETDALPTAKEVARVTNYCLFVQILYSLGDSERREEARIKQVLKQYHMQSCKYHDIVLLQSLEINQHPSAFEQIFGLNYAAPSKLC